MFWGGKIVKEANPCYIKLENSWIVLNSAGGPTSDKRDVWLAPPHDLNSVSSFLNLRVADIHACYEEWSEKSAQFLTEPLDNHAHEFRCYMRDPDGYLIEVGQCLGVRKLRDLHDLLNSGSRAAHGRTGC